MGRKCWVTVFAVSSFVGARHPKSRLSSGIIGILHHKVVALNDRIIATPTSQTHCLDQVNIIEFEFGLDVKKILRPKWHALYIKVQRIFLGQERKYDLMDNDWFEH